MPPRKRKEPTSQDYCPAQKKPRPHTAADAKKEIFLLAQAVIALEAAIIRLAHLHRDDDWLQEIVNNLKVAMQEYGDTYCEVVDDEEPHFVARRGPEDPPPPGGGGDSLGSAVH